MKLYLDIGNTSTKWCLASSVHKYGQCHNREIIEHIGLLLNQNKVEYIFISNVADPGLVEEVRQYSKSPQMTPSSWGVEIILAQVVNDFAGISFISEYESEIGIDRWLAVLAAKASTVNSFCVIDFGTTITLDAVSKEGIHIGGLIFPGAHLLQQSIINNTQIDQKIDTHMLTMFDASLATSTKEALVILPSKLLIPAIRNVITEFLKLQNEPIDVLITGRIEADAIPMLSDNARFFPNLVLQGLILYSKSYPVL
jgi:type III pantothenate kinase